ncbi:Zinc finger, LSD1-type domain containing protein [Parasponia andersonii]|uniref:Zinc finger, LSD1-type domain containing protein n=1 Tax=Parasponia andersonii TaxID=3476 RepID=A0A2P5C4H4_PARAD|nr:Zinc finger, LSD1-type domain containing protein [Parasponia andersonii]
MPNIAARCNRCEAQLLVPIEAQMVKCPLCQSITKITPNANFNNSLIQAGHDSVQNAAARFKSVVNTVMAVNPGFGNYSFPVGGGSNPCYSYYPQQAVVAVPRPRPGVDLVPPTAYGRKRAVVCGVSYRGQKRNVKGSVNDVNCMRYFLVEKMGFPVDSILVLTEYETDPLRIPTRRNMQMALRWLVQGSQPGDSLVFYFSGHGDRQEDQDNDEVDGFDETLCPVDYELSGKIVDDEINATIVRPLTQGTTLHAIIDACYSGTVLDLPFVCKMNRESGCYTWKDQWCPPFCKGTSGGFAVSISACRDNQTSVETNALSGGSELTGAMTYSFIQAVQNEPGLTYGRLLYAMQNTIREARTRGIRLQGPLASLVNKILRTKLSQVPQLSSSEKFDIYSKPFVL